MATVTVRAGEFRALPPTKADYSRALTLDSGPPYVFIGEGGVDTDDRAPLLLGQGLGGQSGAMAIDNRQGSLNAVVSYSDIYQGDQGNQGGGSSKPLYKLVTDYGADKTGVLDSTTAFNLAAAAGSTFIEAGTYKINGIVNWPVQFDLVGGGAGVTILKMGSNGQLKLGDKAVDSAYIGGEMGGFKIDGQGVQNVPGGAFSVGFCLKKKFRNIWVVNTLGDGIVIETAQNCTWDTIQVGGTGRSCVVLDYGAGGHIFLNPELTPGGRHGIEFRQTGQSLGGYPTFLGPSNNLFYGGICEYGDATNPYALIYHGAGTNNQFYGFSSCPTSRTVAAAAILMEAAASAVSTTGQVVLGSANVTVANPAGITPLMAARVPGFPAGSVVANVVGSVVTLFDPGSGATANYPAGTAMSFGAQSGALCFDGLVSPGAAGITTGIETKGNVDITLTGRTTMTNHLTAFKCYSGDRIILDGSIRYFGSPIPTQFTAHPSNDTGTAPVQSTVIRRESGAGMDTVTAPSATARGWTQRRYDQAQPNVVMYPGGMFLSDGTFDPVTTGVSFSLDATDGLHYANVFTQAKTSMLKVTGAAGATVDARYFGRFNAPGAPNAGTWRLGDWIIDSNGTVWACTAAGTPGTWSAGAAPAYTALSYPANAAGNVLAAGHFLPGSAMDTEHRVELRGLVKVTAAFAVGATIATVTAAHRPASLLVGCSAAKYDAGGNLIPASVVVHSDGTITLGTALAINDSMFLDGITYHAA